MTRSHLIALLSILAVETAAAQGGYVVVGSAELPNAFEFTVPTALLTVAPGREDVRALGSGHALTAGGERFNAMFANPALLGVERTSVELLGVGVGIPSSTLDAVSFISDHRNEFQNGDFLVLLSDGYDEFRNGSTPAAKVAGLEKMKRGLAFPHELVQQVAGPPDAPRTHGLGVVPYIAVQLGSWGFSVHNSLQLGFQVSPGTTIAQLAGIQLPDDPASVAPSVLLQILQTLDASFDITGNLRTEALPRVFAVSYNDIVATAGRAVHLGESLTMGASIKVVNRRFSSKIVDPTNMESVLSEVRQEFSGSVTGVTADGGLVYTAASGTRIGIAAQNILPLKTVHSTANLLFRGTQTYYLDGAAQPTTDRNAALVGYYDRSTSTFIPNPAGDTLIYALGFRVNAMIPFELKAPFLVNLGAVHPLSENWEVMAEWYDVGESDKRFDRTIQRLRAGTEVRLWSGMVALRAGLRNDHLTFGAGVDLGILGIDAASATDTFTNERAWFAQVRLGW